MANAASKRVKLAVEPTADVNDETARVLKRTRSAPVQWDRVALASMHPMRVAIIMVLQKNGTASAADIAKVVEQPVSNVSYHMRMLRNDKVIRVAAERRVRGAIATDYELAPPFRG